MAYTLFRLKLQGVVVRIPPIYQVIKTSVLRERPSRLDIARSGYRILVQVEYGLKMRCLGANVSDFHQKVAGQLMLDVEIPFI